MPPENKSSNQPAWLQKVQEQSWEPELFISGIVLFTLFQVPDLTAEFSTYLELYSSPFFGQSTVNESITSVLNVSVYWLIAGFGLHILLRTVWVAFVGISYVYSSEIDYKSLNFRPEYNKMLEKNSGYIERILTLEKLCSAIFAISFMMFGIILGLVCFLLLISVIMFITITLFPGFDAFFVFDALLSIIFIVYFFDLVTLGLLRKIPYFSRAYYPIYRVMRLITLAPLYESIYYGFITNHNRWKVGGAILCFVLFSMMLAINDRADRSVLNMMQFNVDRSDRYWLRSGHYADKYGNDPSNRIQIPSDVIITDVLPVFTVHQTRYEKEIRQLCNYTEKSKGLETSGRDSLNVACLNQFYHLQVNDSAAASNGLYFENGATGQTGLRHWIDISHLPDGPHVLRLFYRFVDDANREINRTEFSNVQFYKSTGNE